MQRVRLVHWNEGEAEERAQRLRAAGYEVEHALPDGRTFLQELGENPPAAVVIDLSRLPSQGRDLALLVRTRKGTRLIPLVFVSGNPAKVARVREILPDATYTSWDEIVGTLGEAIRNPPVDPVVPQSLFDAYAGKPTAEKLGIRANSTVGLVNPPDDLRKVLGKLPVGVRLQEEAHRACDLILWFVRSREELERGIVEIAAMVGPAPLWIAWPKKASGIAVDLVQQDVREIGLVTGLVDYKICSIDETWSGLLFTRAKAKA